MHGQGSHGQAARRFFQVEGPGERPGVRHSSKGRGPRWSQGLSDDEDAEGEADEAELAAELEGSECAPAQRGGRSLPGSASSLPPASPPSGGFQRRWQGKKRRGQAARQVSDDSDLDVEAQAALEQLASPYSRHTPRWAALQPWYRACGCRGV